MVEMKSEIRDGMQIDWDAPIEMDDGVVLRADVYRPVGDGKYPVVLSYGPYAKGLSFQEGYKSNWARLTAVGAGSAQGFEQQVSELGTGRPGEMGAGRLHLSAHQLARRWAFAGRARRLVAARNHGPLSVCRMGGLAAMEQRQGRHQRHFLLRNESMDGRRVAAAASCRFVHLGRLIRLLSRTVPPRRHSQRLSQ